MLTKRKLGLKFEGYNLALRRANLTSFKSSLCVKLHSFMPSSSMWTWVQTRSEQLDNRQRRASAHRDSDDSLILGSTNPKHYAKFCGEPSKIHSDVCLHLCHHIWNYFSIYASIQRLRHQKWCRGLLMPGAHSALTASWSCRAHWQENLKRKAF